MRILVINCGSSSIKYQVVDSEGGEVLLGGVTERVDTLAGGHAEALAGILKEASKHEPQAVGHRVVHGGLAFSAAALIDATVEEAIRNCIPLAPLHNPANLAGIQAAREALPGLPQVAVFDTAFHARMPNRARSYAIPRELASEHGIVRYGFHGSSHACVAERAATYLGRPLSELRIVSCHLGNGASVCAIEYGTSVETSMGMTPLEGLVMGTRCGDLDPGAVLKLCGTLGVEETDSLLNRKSGLAGVSGLGNDMRDLEAKAAEGHDGARLAIKVFAHRVRKYIGAYAAVMGGVDAVILTGGIGQNSASMRQRILQRLEFLGVKIEIFANNDARPSEATQVVDISAPNASARALVVATNEELTIARETSCLATPDEPIADLAIPIAISGRHLHLDRETMDLLFGKGAELEVYREISQPGQFAAKQKVNLVGPRNRIDGVRVLGPLRPKNQIEVSRTDEYKLGVDAPIRGSGKVEGSAPIVLEGPMGTVELSEGLVCARRHIHMTPEDAEQFGVKAGDEVEVAVNGGPRDLTFGDVLVRVKSSYLLEMHIDTDEANAAELSKGAEGDLIYSPAGSGVRGCLQKHAGS
ncbi:MAG: acetate/propionate family kinase [Myxococcales bacterium]|nr:acetate/propionate family kinase [Myxococcales bacterium]